MRERHRGDRVEKNTEGAGLRETEDMYSDLRETEERNRAERDSGEEQA